MFQSKKYIARRRGQSGTDRLEHLGRLVQEYQTTNSLEAKQQVLANLANFAYDPINYDWLWQVNAVDLFLGAVTCRDTQLKEFGMGGLANICLDPQHRDYILSEPRHLVSITAPLFEETSARTDDTVLNAMTTLMFLVDPGSEKMILTDSLKRRLYELQADRAHKQVSTMATLFLEDYYHGR